MSACFIGCCNYSGNHTPIPAFFCLTIAGNLRDIELKFLHNFYTANYKFEIYALKNKNFPYLSFFYNKTNKTQIPEF